MDGVIGIYVVNDQPTKTIRYDLKVSTIKWSDVSEQLYSGTSELIKGTFGSAILSFVERLIVLSLEVENVLVLWEDEHLGH